MVQYSVQKLVLLYLLLLINDVWDQPFRMQLAASLSFRQSMPSPIRSVERKYRGSGCLVRDNERA